MYLMHLGDEWASARTGCPQHGATNGIYENIGPGRSASAAGTTRTTAFAPSPGAIWPRAAGATPFTAWTTLTSTASTWTKTSPRRRKAQDCWVARRLRECNLKRRSSRWRHSAYSLRKLVKGQW